MSGWSVLKGDAVRLPLPSKSVDLVFGSPPYVDARLYLEGGKDLGIARGCLAWVEWMLRVTAEAQRVSRGPVLWVAAGKTKGRNYWPACEGLMWEWWRRGGDCQLYRPCYWHRVGIPGSGGKDWFRADVEYVMCFKRPGPLPWSDNTALSRPPKYGPGGELSHRTPDGSRRSRRLPQTVSKGVVAYVLRDYLPPAKANPGNLIAVPTGGGKLGSKLAHENEAPFPEALAEFFIRSLCPPGGTVLDPFGGSGTTAKVACVWGRQGVSLDLRQSQCDLARRRLTEEVGGKIEFPEGLVA